MSCKLVLDSGAFSSFQTGTPVNLQTYIEYIKEHDIPLYFTLDVIGNVEASWKNQTIMEKAGLNPIPIFHADENIKWLYRCLEYDYMALGGMASGSHENTRRDFLDKCFNVICDTPDRLPKAKVHGLGLASPLLVARYPFFSADTASGIHYGRYGIIIIPARDEKGKVNYLQPPHSLYITERSTAKRHEGFHFANKTKDEQNWILKYVKDRGFSWGRVDIIDVDTSYKLKDNEKFVNKSHTQIERVVEDGIVSNGVLRDYFNIDFYMNMEKAIPEWPWPFQPTMRRMF